MPRTRTIRRSWLAAWVAAAVVGLGARAQAGEPPAPGAAPSVAPDRPTIRTLDRASKEGLVEVSGVRPASYRSIDLVLKSHASEPLTIDLAGRHLRPTSGNPQRLGLSHPITPTTPVPDAPAGTYPILLAPGETRTIRMNTCCMDSGRGCPNDSDRYVLADAPTPPVVEAALRWWVDHPTAEQGLVNSAIWQSDPALLVPPREEGLPAPAEIPPPMPKGRAVKSFGGTAYLLDDGALMSVDREGVRRFHATAIDSAWPGPTGLLAVGVGRSQLELWRFGDTGDPPWMKLVPLGRADVDDLVPTGTGAFVVRRRVDEGSTRTGFALAKPEAVDPSPFDALNGALERVEDLSFGLPSESKHRAVLTFWTKGNFGPGSDPRDQGPPRASKLEVYDFDLRAAKATHRRSFWNVRDAAVGPAGVFGISPGKRLVRLDGERFVDMPLDEEWTDVVAVGAARILVRGTPCPLASLDVATGRWVALPPEAAAESREGVAHVSTLSVDPKTDQVVWIEGDAARRFTPGATEVETIPFR